MPVCIVNSDLLDEFNHEKIVEFLHKQGCVDYDIAFCNLYFNPQNWGADELKEVITGIDPDIKQTLKQLLNEGE